jgi:hypothetical protein
VHFFFLHFLFGIEAGNSDRVLPTSSSIWWACLWMRTLCSGLSWRLQVRVVINYSYIGQ